MEKVESPIALTEEGKKQLRLLEIIKDEDPTTKEEYDCAAAYAKAAAEDPTTITLTPTELRLQIMMDVLGAAEDDLGAAIQFARKDRKGGKPLSGEIMTEFQKRLKRIHESLRLRVDQLRVLVEEEKTDDPYWSEQRERTRQLFFDWT